MVVALLLLWTGKDDKASKWENMQGEGCRVWTCGILLKPFVILPECRPYTCFHASVFVFGFLAWLRPWEIANLILQTSVTKLAFYLCSDSGVGCTGKWGGRTALGEWNAGTKIWSRARKYRDFFHCKPNWCLAINSVSLLNLSKQYCVCLFIFWVCISYLHDCTCFLARLGIVFPFF